MTEANTSGERLSEHDVDRLLQQFFVDEVPEEFQPDDSRVALPRPVLEPVIRTTTSDASRNLAGMLGILVSATCCLIVTMFIPGKPLDEAHLAPDSNAGTNHRIEPVVNGVLPVEERSHLPFTSTGDPDESPGSAAKAADPLEPELEIEIFPLRPDKPIE